MSEDDIDLDRVVSDPNYRRRVIEHLNNEKKDDVLSVGEVVEFDEEPGSPKSEG